MKITETDIKHTIKDFLDTTGVFNYALLQGVASYKGLPDRVMHYKGKVIYLEFKTLKGVLSPKQLDFQSQCEYNGIDYWVIRSLDELIEKMEVDNG